MLAEDNLLITGFTSQLVSQNISHILRVCLIADMQYRVSRAYEREFVQALSERLLMRDMGSAVAYDGESVLDLINDEEPEVMILDLKMPGIDGFEVLCRVKSTNPDVEVIILTGHGSEQDKKTCMDLGVFAYMHKPVDIELLSDTIKQANEKMRKNFNQRA